MAPFYYLPHTIFVAEHGLDHFEESMHAQYELTKRFSAEGSIRPYIARYPERTFERLQSWGRRARGSGCRGRRVSSGSIDTRGACLRFSRC
jgi:3-methyladenine DNA glycosylase AlkC